MRLAILGSTRGTNLDPILAAIRAGHLDAEIALVLSNKEQAGILAKAREHGLPHQYLSSASLTRAQYDAQVSAQLSALQVDVIVLIGYMRILSPEFVRAWESKIINVHPSLLPHHKGLMDLAVHEAVLAAGERQTGCSVHFVTEKVDEGPVLLQKRCDVLPSDTPQTLKQRVQLLEGQALVETLNVLAQEKVS